LDLPAADSFQAYAGKGIQARVDGRQVLLGTQAWLSERGIELDGLVERGGELGRAGATPMYVAVGDRPAGLIGVADTLRPESALAVAELQALGLDIWMLTGDHRATAEAVARQAGIEHVLAEVLPEQKAEKI